MVLHRNIKRLLIVILVLFMSICVCDSTDCYCAQKLATGILNPIFVEYDSVNELYYVAEQPGIVSIYSDNWELLPEPLLNISTDVHISTSLYDERGLLSIAIHPNFALNKYLFTYSIRLYNKKEFAVISKHYVGGIVPIEDVLLVVEQPHQLRNGGQVLFGGDGKLFVSIGDGGSLDSNNISYSQHRESLLGKILRIDVDDYTIVHNQKLPYGFPNDNPFIGNASYKREIYALGVRNMWRCSVDQGSLYCGDTGDKDTEEINIVKSGKNYGWNIYEGSIKKINSSKLENEAPIFEYHHGDMGHAVVGGYVYRGKLFPSLLGKYIFGDYVSGKVFILNPSQNYTSVQTLPQCDKNKCPCHARDNHGLYLQSFSLDKDGEILTLIKERGEIFRLVPPLRESTTCGTCTFNYSKVLMVWIALVLTLLKVT